MVSKRMHSRARPGSAGCKALQSPNCSISTSGRQEGVAAGLRKGQAALILRLLELRFGAVTPEQATLLMNADLSQLSRWGERVVTAASAEDVFSAE